MIPAINMFLGDVVVTIGHATTCGGYNITTYKIPIWAKIIIIAANDSRFCALSVNMNAS